MQSISRYYNLAVKNVSSPETMKSVKENALVAFAATAFFTGNPEFAVISGVLGALATLIDAVTRPIFRDLFGNNYELVEVTTRTFVNLYIMGQLMKAFTNRRINIVKCTVMTVGAYILSKQFNGNLPRNPFIFH